MICHLLWQRTSTFPFVQDDIGTLNPILGLRVGLDLEFVRVHWAQSKNCFCFPAVSDMFQHWGLEGTLPKTNSSHLPGGRAPKGKSS